VVGTASPERRSLLDGASNFRDLGGYRTFDQRVVRNGMLFRSGALHALTAADHDRLRAIGVRVAIDLRPPEEQAAEPTNAPFLRIVPVPLMRGERTSDRSALANGEGYLRDRYMEILLDRAADIGAIFEVLAQEDGLPAIIHCAAGKDRTGVSIALLLAVVGVDDQVIADDYALTDACVGDFYAVEGRQWLSRNGYTWEQYGHLIACPPERMLHTLGHLERGWGSPAGYLTAHGLAPEALSRLGELLTEPLA
jgi:protein-tyrosine phosphatase